MKTFQLGINEEKSEKVKKLETNFAEGEINRLENKLQKSMESKELIKNQELESINWKKFSQKSLKI